MNVAMKMAGTARLARCLAIFATSAVSPFAHASDDLLAACNQPDFQTVLRATAKEDAPTEASAIWLNRQLIKWPGSNSDGAYRLYVAQTTNLRARVGQRAEGGTGYVLNVSREKVPDVAAERFKYVGDGVVLKMRDSDQAVLRDLLTGQVVVVEEDDKGLVRRASYLQIAGVLDGLFGGAGNAELGVTLSKPGATFALWAPTAKAVSVCVYKNGNAPSATVAAMLRDPGTGVWRHQLNQPAAGQYYTYLLDVYVPGVGFVRNRVTDPYSVSLTADSKRSFIVDLNTPHSKPNGWDKSPRPSRVKSSTDMSIYELHVRDFSINDATVSEKNRGKYLAFTETSANGAKHLAALSKAGLTDVHLLPVFDIASVPESGCVTPKIVGAPDSEAQQATIAASAGKDCFNWGYDPFHFNAPEGSYASDAADGMRRIVEFRRMVAALHRMGLRVGMDVVYNHTSASGQNEKSVLDRIVPGYYHRLNATGKVEQSTCCENTATENLMMAKLMIDSAVLWATHYKIDSFRFDLMAHQPRAVMEELQTRVDKAAGRHINLIGEGWNFGEVENGKRFVQASQLSLNGSGIGTFTDRMRDAVRGGAYNNQGADIIKNQGYINGLVYAPNALADRARPKTDLLKAADMVRVGLAGSIRDYPMTNYLGAKTTLEKIDYNGQAAGYAREPNEIVNYAENHDNQTLFDINAYKLPLDTTREDRARVQMLGAAIVAFSQGVAYFHAGIDTLRSKSLDGNSFDSGDWFNRLDWSYQDNYFGTGLPRAEDNRKQFDVMKPLLVNADIKPTAKEIKLARDLFRDLLAIRESSTLFRMRTAADIKSRLRFFNTGAAQNPVVIVGHMDGAGYAGAGLKEVVYFINVDPAVQEIVVDEMKGSALVLHPVHARGVDARVAREAAFDRASGKFRIPARSAVVFVVK